jgi:hypothetical protein
VSILLDAGPSLNFLAVGQENILIQVAASRSTQLAVPQRVYEEVVGVAKSPRFKRTAVTGKWPTLKDSGRLRVLDDTLATVEMTEAVARISGVAARDRIKTRQSLGEILVLAHASVFAQQGEEVFVLIDESDGRRRAKKEKTWLQDNGHPGSLHLWGTPQVLQDAARRPGWIKGGLTWQAVYDQMEPYDDALPPRPGKKPRR